MYFTNLGLKGLIPYTFSPLKQEDHTHQGINVKNGPASARIGIIGSAGVNCSSNVCSVIGFGTSGDTSCGNSVHGVYGGQGSNSKEAFGYILVQWSAISEIPVASPSNRGPVRDCSHETGLLLSINFLLDILPQIEVWNGSRCAVSGGEEVVLQIIAMKEAIIQCKAFHTPVLSCSFYLLNPLWGPGQCLLAEVPIFSHALTGSLGTIWFLSVRSVNRNSKRRSVHNRCSQWCLSRKGQRNGASVF